MKGGIDTSAGKVNAIQYLLAIFGEHGVGVAIKLKWESRVVLNSTGDPEARRYLIVKPPANGIALILRIRKLPAGRYSLRIIAQE